MSDPYRTTVRPDSSRLTSGVAGADRRVDRDENHSRVLTLSGPSMTHGGDGIPYKKPREPTSGTAGRTTGARRLTLLPGWEKRLADHGSAFGTGPAPALCRATEPRSDGTILVRDRRGTEAILDLARRRPIARVGLAGAMRLARPPVPIHRGRSWSDPRSVVPLLLAVVLVEIGDERQEVFHRFAIEPVEGEILIPLETLLRQSITFVLHQARDLLFGLRNLGLPTPDRVWDAWVAERAFRLGRHHPRYGGSSDEAERAWVREKTSEDLDFACGLIATCSRRGVDHPYGTVRDRLLGSIPVHLGAIPLPEGVRACLSADAEAAARLYPIQVREAVSCDALEHLLSVEMPWTLTNASMIWEGIRVDPELCSRLLAACRRHHESLAKRLGEAGLHDPDSRKALTAYFGDLGLLDAFRESGSYRFDDSRLKPLEDRHPAVSAIRERRKIRRVLADRLLSGELIGADGRLHPDHRQLGAESGRNTMRDPNVGGIGRALRPLVVPDDPEFGAIGEVDLTQIEVLIAAAESGDPELLRMVNGGDVYVAMARRYHARDLSLEDQALNDRDFKARFRLHRERMKVFTLAVIYNITPKGLARLLGIAETQAAEERHRFLAMFPTLARSMETESAYGALRGYARLKTGLRRHRAGIGPPNRWEVNWLRNTPLQGSAGIVFKVAGNRLHRRLAYFGARLILPLHDAYVFECPRDRLEEVARTVAEVMRSVVQE